MTHRFFCVAVTFLLLAQFAFGGEYEGTLTDLKKGKSATVKIDGKERTFKLDGKMEVVFILSDDTADKSSQDELATNLPFAKGGLPVRITTKGEKEDEMITKLIYGKLQKDPPKTASEINFGGGLKGEWLLVAGSKSGESKSTDGDPLRFTDKSAEWNYLPYLNEEKGKGTITVNAAKKPSTIELRIGEKVYKGIYIIDKVDEMQENLLILFNVAGADFPTKFGESIYDLPKGFPGLLLQAERKKK